MKRNFSTFRDFSKTWRAVTRLQKKIRAGNYVLSTSEDVKGCENAFT